MAEPASRIARFSVAERLLHWLLAVTFFALLVTGLFLSVPALEGTVTRPTVKAWHIDAAIALAVGFLVIVIVRGRALSRTASELERFDSDDRRWLAQVPRRVTVGAVAPPQGRFNAGQKLNTAVIAGLMVVSYITGFLLWYGERDTAYRFTGTITVHDDVMYLLIILVVGHLYMALVNPHTRAALPGIVGGSVDRAWARRHHAKWVAESDGTADAQDGPDRARGTEPAPPESTPV
jgi:formate dehydrogenase subunit gamma